jgi:Copper type II ascorbate-dependent monooxygenase, C-terminal domain
MRRALGVVACALLFVGCNREPTWERDVAPVVAKNCEGCHRDSGAAFAITPYATARGQGDAINEMVSTHQMPPWPPERLGGCPTFIGDRSMSDDDVETIDRWVKNGMLKGLETGAKEPTPPTFGQLDGISVELAPDAPYLPSAAGDDYRCFVLDPKLASDAFITAYRMTAGAGVHHVQLWELTDDVGTAQIEAADDAAPGPGFPCTTWPGAAIRVLTVWGPSDPVRIHPKGTGVRVNAGKKLVLQVHFHHASGPSQPSIGLVLANSVGEEATLLEMSPPSFVLPPRTPKTSVHAAMAVLSNAKLWGIRAHMHSLGSEVRLSRTTADGTSCLLSIPRWDANWQLMYFYEHPLELGAGDVINLDCSYDTRTRNEPVQNGPLGDDEMCNGYFYVTGIAPR